ncbi:hypothetical protein J1N35_004517 [Gossypium stocksii]|uniref:Uncharacterized protein n=1 Tax=Gossypium stocksii TaxID=47602 RepID=A0A9D3WCX4_9ROSI|nr:hypothetical protein J1N35_004517 [Gossypium stocksii]
MNSGDKQDREGQFGETLEESLASSGRVSVQESEINAILPAASSDDPEVGTEALTQIVREVLEKVFEASLERTRWMVQAHRRSTGPCAIGNLGFSIVIGSTWPGNTDV